jgi:hypothetical protein
MDLRVFMRACISGTLDRGQLDSFLELGKVHIEQTLQEGFTGLIYASQHGRLN